MYAERPPDPELSGRLACVWHQVSETEQHHLVVPDACVDLIWGPGGLFVAGPDTGPMPTPMAAGDTFTGVRFRPGAVGDFFGVPLHELRDRRVPLADLPFPAERIEEAAPRPGSRLTAMRAEVRRRLAATAGADPAGAALTAVLREGRTVAQAAWRLGFSERQLHRRTLASFGYAPKTLQRIVRFQRALRLARAGVPLAEVAVRAGFTDQAHLSHDVRRLSGVSMSRLLSPAGRAA
ncbi:helix-turn-helix domain-containing protein [Nonomuraea mesophila]|uniref:Helix-turn-helix domain-containing protein n=1 Tax=Nonomuraea mesophila TaxID=2530382 RepID=A0A4V2Z5E9_9ACTN|nr:helix-turn-helix transcriptional regulator [Nonomuraea mesophila]TDE22133.1 helix-turn-helix domain-containing protein [Nonomuraea mesophila]